MTSDPIAPPDPIDEALRPMDEAVRRALVDSHQDLLKYLTKRLNGPQEAEEVLQRFMLKAIERAGDLREVKAVKGWLSRVLATTIADFQRAAIRRRQRETIVDPHDRPKRSMLIPNPMMSLRRRFAIVCTGFCPH